MRPYRYGAYLVDTFSPVVCWSLTRMTAADGNVVRVRRTSDSAESDFTGTEVKDGTLEAWITGSDDGFIVKMYNQGTGGSSYDSVQATAGLQPRVILNGFMGTLNDEGVFTTSPAGSDRYLRSPQITEIDAEPFSIFNVSYGSFNSTYYASGSNTISASPNAYRIITYTGTYDDGANIYLGIVATSGGSYGVSATSVLTQDIFYTHSFISDSSKNIEGFVNGTSHDTNTFTSTYRNASFDLGQQLGGTSPMKGQIAAYIVFGTDETSNQTAISNKLDEIYAHH